MIRMLLSLIPKEQRGNLRRFQAMLVLSVLTRAAACVILVPLIGGLLSETPGDAVRWLVIFTVVVVVNSITQFRLARLGFALGLTAMEVVQLRVIDHLSTLPLGWFSASHRALAQRTIASTGPQVAQSIGNLVVPFISAVTLPLAIAVGLLFVAWPLGLAALVATPLILLAWAGGNRAARRADKEFADAVADLDDRVIEFGRTQRVLRGARRADPENSAAGKALQRAHTATIRLLRWAIPGELLFSVASQLALLSLAVVALALLRQGTITIAEAIALIVVVVRFLEPFTSLAEISAPLQAITTSMREVEQVLAASPLITTDKLDSVVSTPTEVAIQANQAADLVLSPPLIAFNDVVFSYGQPSEPLVAAVKPTIDHVSFDAPAGLITAIVGPSGSGKSTLLGLLARFHDVGSGEVRIDGTNVRDLDPVDLMADLSMVFQEVYLFEGTIRENIAIGDPDANEEMLNEVAALARVDEIIERLAEGWNTQVGEGGTALSGGERQRVSIARALLKPTRILLVDEATSALDSENEAAMVAALDAERGKRTILVVAHRLRTIQHADQIVFLENGQVVELGTPAELMAQAGRFATYWREQEASSVWTLGSGT